MRPHAVLPGATVGVLAPASPVQLPWLEAGEAELRRVGLVPRRSRNLLKRSEYTAGSAAERTEDFLALLEDEEVSALFGARGGYGCLDLLPRIPPDRIRNRPKVLLGGSDLTALLALASGAGVGSSMARWSRSRSPAARRAGMRRRRWGCCGPESPGFTSLGGMRKASIRDAPRGPAGRLSLDSGRPRRTPFAVSFRDAIAVLEDISVKPYQIDRMLTQLSLAGLLEGVQGIVFGRMPGCTQHPDQGYTTAELLARLSEQFEVPVVFGFATGHTDEEPCRTVPFEVRARMDEDGLTLLEGAVE